MKPRSLHPHEHHTVDQSMYPIHIIGGRGHGIVMNRQPQVKFAITGLISHRDLGW